MHARTSPTGVGDEGGGGNDGNESSTSSSLPDLVPAGTTTINITTAGGHDESISDSNPSLKLNTSSSSSASRTGNEGNYSQASTAIADEVYQSESRRESSEEGMSSLLKKKSSSSSSSMGKSRSDTSSSIYPASNPSSLASSLSSNPSPGVSPDVHPHALESVKEDIMEEELCSQDLFANKEDLSQEVRISTPQDRSTPVDNIQKEAKAQDLYKQALTRTSTPLDSQQLHTPPSHDGFNCLQFSGTSSSGPKSVSPSESYSGAPLIIPSSPTEQSVSYTALSTASSSSIINPSPSSFSYRAATVSSSVSTAGSGSTSLEIINPSPSSFQYRPTTISSTPEEETSDKKHTGSLDKDNEEFDGLPQWQQQLLAKQKVEEEVVPLITTSTPSDSSSSSNSATREPSQEQHPWQSSMLDSTKSESCVAAGTLKEKHTVKHVTFLMDESQKESFSDSKSDRVDKAKDDNNDSLSPSSLVIDDQQGLANIAASRKIDKTACSQPEMSEDLFGASSYSSQDQSDNQGSIPVCQATTPPPTIADEEQQDFELFLSQMSQVDSPGTTSVTNRETDIGEVIVPLCSLLMNQGKGPINPVFYKSLTQHTMSEKEPSQPPSKHVDSPGTTTVTHQCDTDIGEVIVPLCSLLMNQGKSPINPVFYRSLTQHTMSEKEPSQPPSKHNTERHDTERHDKERHDTEPAEVQVTPADHSNQKPNINSSSKPVVPPLLTELSSESVAGSAFHFSLPTSAAPLRPLTCTTPPPMRTWEPAVEPTAVCETPSIPTPDSNTETTAGQQHPTPSLSFSMARQESPVGDTENRDMEISFKMYKPPSSKPSKTSTTTHSTEVSVFQRARKDAKQHRLTIQKNNEEHNPFLFSLQEAVSPPVSSKRQKPNKSSTTKAVPSRATTSPTPEQQLNIPGRDELSSYVKTTKIRTIKTITTVVKRIISIETTKEGSDKVIETFSYEEEDDPHIETSETEKVGRETFVETENSTYVRQPARKPTPTLDTLPRVSPRRKRRKETTTSSDEVPHEVKRTRVDSTSKSSTETTRDKTKSPSKLSTGSSPPALRRQTTDTVVDQTTSTTPADEMCLTPGMRVFARWSDNFFYPGVLTGSSESKTGTSYNVLFDDGDKRKVHSDQVIARESLKIGQTVLAQDPDGFYDPGTVVGHYPSGSGRGYEIELSSSKKHKRYLEKFVILSEEQARTIVRTSSSSSSNLSRVGSDVSDKSKSCRSSSGGLSIKSRDTSAKDTSCSSNELKRTEQPLVSPKKKPSRATKGDEETPKSSRKVRRLRNIARLRRQGAESSSEGSPEERLKKRGNRAKKGLLKKLTLPTRTSPRKTTQSSTDKIESTSSSIQDAIPSNNTLFAGLAFLITGCRNPTHVSTDSESEHVEFDRARLKRQIDNGGGVVLESFEETQKTVADQCFLVSNSFQRTIKYFQCLAYGIPLVHHMWIQDSSVLNRLQKFKKYLLPAGRSIETDEVVEYGSLPRPKILHGLNIYLQGDSNFKRTWSSVVMAAGGHVIAKLPNRPGRVVYDTDLCDVVISNVQHLPQSLQYTCEMLGIPVVGLEWLFQCLINGYVVDYNGHPSYDYKNVSKEDMPK